MDIIIGMLLGLVIYYAYTNWDKVVDFYKDITGKF